MTVRDTGIGIAPENIKRIFDAFEQAELPADGDAAFARQFGGLGLGLAICRVLVEQHRGSIRAHSEGEGRGSTFVVELPGLPRPAKADTTLQSRPSSPQKLSRLRLLVVDDQPDTAFVLSRLLTSAGHQVQTANTGGDALKLAAQHAFDIIFSDLGLPDMTGFDLMRQIKERQPIKGIAVSGYGMEEDIKKSQEAGFSDHLVKPVSLEQIEQSLRRVAVQL